MALSRAKYKRIHDLYTPGHELVLKDGTVMWLQVLNPFERDEAQRDAGLARSRLVLALKGPHAEEERSRVVSQFLEHGRESAVDVLATSLTNQKLSDIMNRLKDDPDWRERVDMIDRADALSAAPLEPAEQATLDDVNAEYLAEVNERMAVERKYQSQRLESMSDDELVEQYVDVYVDTRGGAVAMAEYNLTEAWYAARVCEGVLVDGAWDHGGCENHSMQVWETKTELRNESEELQNAILGGLRTLAMTVREARFLDSKESSSVSSPPPSEPAESTPSTPVETPAPARGRSAPRSSTR